MIKLQETLNNRNVNYKQNFRGIGGTAVSALKFLNDSPAVGACAVDLGSMVIPRTLIDMKNRGPQAGTETLIREGSSTTIHACVGLVGALAGTLLSGGINKQFGVKANKIFTNGQTVDLMSDLWKQSGHDAKKFYGLVLDNMQGLNGSNWQQIGNEVKNKVVDTLANGELTKKGRQIMSSEIIQNTGAQANYMIKSGSKNVEGSLDVLLDSAKSLGDAFSKQAPEKIDAFVKKLKGTKLATAALGLGICSAMCMSIQPINKYLTKKRTGSDGFVGVKGRKADKSSGFKLLKTGIAAATATAALSTIGNTPKAIIDKVQYTSKIPNLSQFKLLYGLTLTSRFASARDKDELRECLIKDTLGYTNWLILGGMVSKLTARAMGKNLINNPLEQTGKKGLKYGLKWLTKASVKSYDEVLMPTAKQLVNNGEPLKFTKMLKNATPEVKKNILKIAGSQVAGYLYSGIVLGVGIAKLNIFITNKVEKSRAEKLAKKTATNGLVYFAKTDKIAQNFNKMMENSSKEK